MQYRSNGTANVLTEDEWHLLHDACKPEHPEELRLVLGEIGNPDDLQKSRSQFRDMDMAVRRDAVKRISDFFANEKQVERLRQHLPYATDQEIQALDAITSKLEEVNENA
jgi:hypothetical protein